MIDLKLLSAETEQVKIKLTSKGYDCTNVDTLLALVNQAKTVRKELEDIRSTRNKLQKDNSVSNESKREMRDNIVEREGALADLEKKIEDIWLYVPNLPDEDAPVGNDASGNVVVAECADYRRPDIEQPLPHWEIGQSLNILDMASSSKMSGKMFSLFVGKGARLLRALINYGLSLHSDKYLELIPPHLVSRKTLTYTGHLPRFSEEQYETSRDDLWLIPTAEVPLTSYFADHVFSADELPKRSLAYTVCFRREAGSYGKDTRGLQRVHEFHKVELLKVVEPSRCKEELADLLEDCLRIIKDLKLQYRVVDLCTGDMGDKYGRCYDIEVFAPGVQKWLEVSSVGHFSDYQARRANIRFQARDGSKHHAYTLNGSGIATPRVWAAIIEAYQQSDGSVLVPEVLVPFMGCTSITKG